MKTLDDKLIIYDSNCKICSSLKDVILSLTSIPEVKIRAYKDLDLKYLHQVDAEKFRNVMALIDINQADTIYGAEGVAFIFSSQYKILNYLFSIKMFYWLFAGLYNIQANNRYIMAMPKSKFTCNCYPDEILKLRIGYILIGVTISILLTMLFGLSVQRFITDLSPLEAVIQMLLMAGIGWVLQIITAAIVMKDKALEYVGHLATIMVIGLLILIPTIIATTLFDYNSYSIPIISVICSSSTMLYMHFTRIKYLQKSQLWTVSWFLYLQSSAAFWIYMFYNNYLLS